MKRTCDKCVAFGLTCELGYATKTKYHNGYAVGSYPIESCPKPVIISKYLELRKAEEDKDE